VRVLCNSASYVGSAFGLAVVYTAPGPAVATAGILLIQMTSAINVAGVNYMDIAGPENSGVLMAVGNSIANCGGGLAPAAAAALGSVFGADRWDAIFPVTAMLLLVSASAFAVFCEWCPTLWQQPHSFRFVR
jgi:hypothetical protein